MIKSGSMILTLIILTFCFKLFGITTNHSHLKKQNQIVLPLNRFAFSRSVATVAALRPLES